MRRGPRPHSLRHIAWMLLVLLCAACSTPSLEDEPLTIANTADGGILLTNNADGYTVSLPAGAQVDNSLGAIRTAVSWEGVRLYLYAQDTTPVLGQLRYINYSNTFLDESRGVTLVESIQRELGGCEAVCRRWTRRALSRIENDLPNYACFDVKYKLGRVYTLYFKYADTVSYEDDILPVAESFRVKSVTAEPPPEPRLGTTPGPALDRDTQAAFDALFSDNAPLTWGLFTPDILQRDQVDQIERAVDHEFPIYLLYSGFQTTSDGYPMLLEHRLYDLLDTVCPAGKIPELTLQTEPQPEGLMIYDVLDGVYDQFLHRYAADVAAYGRPVLFRLGNEMNGDWCCYSAFHTCRDADIFVEFYRYVFSIFQQEGANNCIWIFNPNHQSFPDFKWNDELLYYPGDAYMNVVGLTAYNTGTYYDTETWNTFDELYRDLYDAYVRRYAQPLMITEFASSSVGGDKPAWIADMFTSLPDYPAIKAAVWWNGVDYDWTDPDAPVISRPYLLDETAETLEAFRRGLSGIP